MLAVHSHHVTLPYQEKKRYLGLTNLPPLFNMFGVQLPPHSGSKRWVARNSGWGGGRLPEKRGGGERVERSVVQQVKKSYKTQTVRVNLQPQTYLCISLR